MEEFDKDKLKVDAFLTEYSEIRHESRTYEVLMVICIILSSLTFIALFIAAIFSHQFVLLYISPLVSLFFILLTMGILAYNTTLGLRGSQIEESLKDILNEPTIQWESTAGIFRTASEDILTTKIGRYWMMISIFVFATGVAPILLSLMYEFYEFLGTASIRHPTHPTLVWVIIGMDTVMTAITLYIGYNFFIKRGWEKLKVPF